MINEILTSLGMPYKETQFLRPPNKTYAVYFDDVTTDGPDGVNRIFTHNITVEVYELSPEPTVEAALESELNLRGIRWTKQARYWVQDAQRYQVIYEFSYITKT